MCRAAHARSLESWSITEAPKVDGGCKPFFQLLKDLLSLEYVGLKTKWFEDLFWRGSGGPGGQRFAQLCG